MEKQADGISGDGCGASFHVPPLPGFQTSALRRKTESIRAIHGVLQISGVVIFAAHDSNLLLRGTE